MDGWRMVAEWFKDGWRIIEGWLNYGWRMVFYTYQYAQGQGPVIFRIFGALHSHERWSFDDRRGFFSSRSMSEIWKYCDRLYLNATNYGKAIWINKKEYICLSEWKYYAMAILTFLLVSRESSLMMIGWRNLIRIGLGMLIGQEKNKDFP